MAALHELQWKIQQQLHQLVNDARRDLLHQLAGSCKDQVGEEVPREDTTEVELFDFIVDFLRSKQLRSLEDRGMSRLLVFRDLVDKLQTPQEAEAGAQHQSADEAEVASVSETEQIWAAPIINKTVSTPVVAVQTNVTTFEDGTKPEMKRLGLDSYQCPFCPKVGPYYRLVPHLQSHQRACINYGGYRVYKCHLGCVAYGHYHCGFCPRIIIRKEYFFNHFKKCLCQRRAMAVAVPSALPAETTGPPALTPGTTGQPALATGTTGQPALATGTTGQPALAPGTTGQPALATGTTGQPALTPGTTGQPALATGTTGQPALAPGTTGQPALATGTTGQPALTTGTTGQPALATGTTGQPALTPGTTGQPALAPGTTGQPALATGTTGQPALTTGTTGQPALAPGTTGPPELAPGTTGPPALAPGTTGQPALPAGTTGPPALTPGTTGPPALAPGTTGPPALAPGTTGPPALAPGTTGPPALPAGTTGPPALTPGTTGQPALTPGTTGPPALTPGTTGQPALTPGTTGPPALTPGTTGQPALAPETKAFDSCPLAPAAAVKTPKILLSKHRKTRCCLCNLELLQKNLKVHIQRQHLLKTPDITANHSVEFVCVDEKETFLQFL